MIMMFITFFQSRIGSLSPSSAEISTMSQVSSTDPPSSTQEARADGKGPPEKAVVKPQDAEEEIDIDLDAPETEKAALAIQSQFRRFQKKKK
ncbi:Purkinje cell protein 4-like protein 1 [Salminus brasiliensis]|uniref:Purkinje cell protein 4-like protein 1 n=1 Tax=Salminus brasiliensis TaxID=930266 RepID=UPI003B82D169